MSPGPRRSEEVDAWLAGDRRWPEECARLREILLDSGLDEAIKWGKPCYAHDGGNVAIIQEFKAFAALLFFKGALLEDDHGVLQEQGENTRSALRACFTSPAQVDDRESVLRTLIHQAVEVERQGLAVPNAGKLVLVDELRARLAADPALEVAFRQLTPGRQRAYNLYFSRAKRASTRAARVEKCVPRILAGKGLRD